MFFTRPHGEPHVLHSCARYTVPPPRATVRGAVSPAALQCLADLKDIQASCIPPLTAAAAAIHPTLSPIVVGLHDALQFMHHMFVKLYAAQAHCSIAFMCRADLMSQVHRRSTRRRLFNWVCLQPHFFFAAAHARLYSLHHSGSADVIMQVASRPGQRRTVAFGIRSLSCRVSQRT